MKNQVLNKTNLTPVRIALSLCIFLLLGTGCKKFPDKGSEFFSFSNPVKIDKGSNRTGSPDIAIGPSGDLFVLFIKTVDEATDIFFSRSRDRGVTWSDPVNISKSLNSSSPASIAINREGDIYAAWREHGSYERSFIHTSRSTDNGATWSQAVSIPSANPLGWSDVKVAVDSRGYLGVVWHEYPPNVPVMEAYFSRSTDNGSTWSQKFQMEPNNAGGSFPVIKMDNADNIRIASIIYGNVHFTRSIDDGNSWSPAHQVSNRSGMLQNLSFDLDNEDNAYLTWMDLKRIGHDYNYNLYYARSHANGTWSTPELLREHHSDNYGTAIAVSENGSVNLIWSSKSDDSEFEMSYMRREKNDGYWSEPVNVVGQTRFPSSPAMAVAKDGTVYAVWGASPPENLFGGGHVYFAAGKEN